MEIANTIDEKLFMDYTRRRARQIKDIVKKGILEGIDWSNLRQPFGTSSFPYSVCTPPSRRFINPTASLFQIPHSSLNRGKV